MFARPQTGPKYSSKNPQLHSDSHFSTRQNGFQQSLNVTGTKTGPDDCFDFTNIGAIRGHESLNRTLKKKQLANELISDSEIEYLIKEKLRKEKYAVECLFKNADPMGRGKVTKGALLKVLYSICGHIRVEQFHRLLERLELDGKNNISFAEFSSCFVERVPTSDLSHPSVQVGRYSTKPVSVAHAHTLLRQRVQQGNFDLHDILPPSCFQSDGLVLKPQWRDAVKQLKIPIADQDFDKFWERFDTNCTGGVRIQHLAHLLGLNAKHYIMDDEFRLSRSKTAPVITSRLQSREVKTTTTEVKVTVEREVTNGHGHQDLRPIPKSARSRTSRQSDNCSSDLKFLRRYELLKRKRPVFDFFLDNLFYLFEEVYNSFLVTFRHMDVHKDGQVTQFDFRSILQDFGFPISCLAFESFLSRSGVRCVRGHCSYMDFLSRFQAKGNGSLLRKQLQARHSPLQDVDQNYGPGDELTAVQLEIQLLRFFHADYIQLYFAFFDIDTENTGVVSEPVFRAILTRMLKSMVGIPYDQFEEVLKKVKRNKDGSVFYNSFLNLFDIQPNTWQKNSSTVRKFPKSLKAESPPPFADILLDKERESLYLTGDDDLVLAGGEQLVLRDRPLSELCTLVETALRNRFHQADKVYKSLDRRNTGRITKKQFATILKAVGVVLTDKECDNLWATLDTNIDGQWTYRQLIRHFMTNLHEKIQDKKRKNKAMLIVLPNIEYSDDVDIQRLRRFRSAQNLGARPQLSEQDRVKSAERKVLIDALVDKARPAVLRQWDDLKSIFRHFDPQGTATVERNQFRVIMSEYKVPLSERDLDILCEHYDYKKNGRVKYLDFIKKFAKSSENKPRSKLADLGRTFVNLKEGVSYPVEDIIERIRDQLLRQWKSLLQAFRKYDHDKTGLLSEVELRRIVLASGLDLSRDDVFLLLTEFDSNFDGKINYQEFLMQLLNVC